MIHRRAPNPVRPPEPLQERALLFAGPDPVVDLIDRQEPVTAVLPGSTSQQEPTDWLCQRSSALSVISREAERAACQPVKVHNRSENGFGGNIG
jgi:hypothetical protein